MARGLLETLAGIAMNTFPLEWHWLDETDSTGKSLTSNEKSEIKRLGCLRVLVPVGVLGAIIFRKWELMMLSLAINECIAWRESTIVHKVKIRSWETQDKDQL